VRIREEFFSKIIFSEILMSRRILALFSLCSKYLYQNNLESRFGTRLKLEFPSNYAERNFNKSHFRCKEKKAKNLKKNSMHWKGEKIKREGKD